MAGDLKRFIGRVLIYEGRDYVGSRDNGDGTVDFARPKGRTGDTHPYTVVTIAPEHDRDFEEGSLEEIEVAIRANAADWHKRVTTLQPASVLPGVKPLTARRQPQLTSEQTKRLDQARQALGRQAIERGEDSVRHVKGLGKSAKRKAAGAFCYLVNAVSAPPMQALRQVIEVDKETKAPKRGAQAGAVSISMTEPRGGSGNG